MVIFGTPKDIQILSCPYERHQAPRGAIG